MYSLCEQKSNMMIIIIIIRRWTDPYTYNGGLEGSRRLRLLKFGQSEHEGDKVNSFTHRPPLPPEAELNPEP